MPIVLNPDTTCLLFLSLASAAHYSHSSYMMIAILWRAASSQIAQTWEFRNLLHGLLKSITARMTSRIGNRSSESMGNSS